MNQTRRDIAAGVFWGLAAYTAALCGAVILLWVLFVLIPSAWDAAVEAGVP